MSINNRSTIYFSKYAEKKFELLNRHKVYFTHELIEDCLSSPEEVGKLADYFTARKEGVKVVYKKEVGVIIVLTFYPVK
ncbi:MAG: hypothetical protein NT091_02070 [Candidatus Falkowbacteria bacterium]|nr:hypothetical protein [Candidatus Falkowbacteria bacterium]